MTDMERMLRCVKHQRIQKQTDASDWAGLPLTLCAMQINLLRYERDRR